MDGDTDSIFERKDEPHHIVMEILLHLIVITAEETDLVHRPTVNLQTPHLSCCFLTELSNQTETVTLHRG